MAFQIFCQLRKVGSNIYSLHFSKIQAQHEMEAFDARKNSMKYGATKYILKLWIYMDYQGGTQVNSNIKLIMSP